MTALNRMKVSDCCSKESNIKKMGSASVIGLGLAVLLNISGVRADDCCFPPGFEVDPQPPNK